MSDLISRKEAICAIEHRLAEPAYLHIGEDWYVGMNCAESELYNLPSTHLEPCEDAVSREALRKAMYHRAFETDGDTMWQSGCWIRYRAVEQVIKESPSVTPKQHTGKWIYGENLGNGHDGYFCSECGWFAAVDYDFPINSEENKPTNFCPNCGANMRGEKDGCDTE